MQVTKSLALALALITMPMLAHGDHHVAKTLVKLSVSAVEPKGSILTEDAEAGSEVLVGIPVTIQLPNACTTFVGQMTDERGVLRSLMRPRLKLEVFGAQDPTAPVCTAIAPEPVETELTVRLSPGDRSERARQLVDIDGTAYRLDLNLRSDEVSITRISAR